jgi:tripartite-type tricarboxylate transporter receptor subunit TctC
MKTVFSRILAKIVVVSVAAMMAQIAFAQTDTFPSKPVTLIVPFPAGGSADNMARMLAKHVGDRWRQNVVVVNRPGAGTIIGLGATANAAPDGYTIGMNSISHIVQPAVRARLPFDPVNDFSYITKLLEAPFVLTVNSGLPVKSVAELTSFMKANPGKVNYASFGVGSAGHIFVEILLQHTGAIATHVPYKGTGEATMAQLNGDAPIMFDMITSPLQHIRSGKLRPLLVTTSTRSKELPDVPTGKELGISGLVMPTWFGLIGPKGIPANIQSEINAAFTSALRSPDIVAALDKQGLLAAPSTPEELRTFVVSSIDTINKTAAAANIQKVD